MRPEGVLPNYFESSSVIDLEIFRFQLDSLLLCALLFTAVVQLKGTHYSGPCFIYPSPFLLGDVAHGLLQVL